VLLLLVAELPWSGPEVTRREVLEISMNKEAVLVELGVWRSDLDLVVAVAEDGDGRPRCELHGEFLLQVGDHHMAAFVCRHDFWLRWQPLQMPSMASNQPPMRRPSVGFLTAIFGLRLPSGFVPGEIKDGRRWSPCCGGGEEGLDCFLFLSFRVLYVKFQDCFVTVLSFAILYAYCNPPSMK